jgi:hypothetical protein
MLSNIEDIDPLITEKNTTPNTIMQMHTYFSLVFVPEISPYPTVAIVVTEK